MASLSIAFPMPLINLQRGEPWKGNGQFHVQRECLKTNSNF